MNRMIIHGGLIMSFINEAYEAMKVERADILIKGGRIAQIGREIAVNHGDRVIDATDKLIIPGLINAHNHCLTTAVCRGMTDDYNRERYGGAAIYSRVFPLKRLALQHLDEEELASLLQLNLAEAINSGTTTIAEQCTGREMELFIHLADSVGLRACVSPMFTSGKNLPEASRSGQVELATVREEFAVLEENVRLHERYDGSAGGRISIWLGPHAPESCSTALLREVRRVADQKGMRIMTHLAQTRVEVRKIRERFDRTPVEYLADIGLLGPDVVAAHAVFTSDSDRQLIKEYGVNVAHCPQVFAKGGMIAPFHPYTSIGVNVAIGTDSYSMDALAEMRMAAMVGKIQTGNAHSVTASDAFFAATVGGAIALAQSDLGRLALIALLQAGRGRLAVGQRADLLVLNLRQAHIQPVAYPVISLVYHAQSTDIEYVIIDGWVVKDHGQIFGLDQAALADRAAQAADKVWALAREEGAL